MAFNANRFMQQRDAATELARYASHFNMRLGQFIYNIIPNSPQGSPSLFLMQDEELLSLARDYFNEFGG